MATAIKSILPTVPDTPVETLSRQLSVADVDISAGGAAGLGVPAPSRSHHPSNAGRDGSPISLNVAGPLDTSLRPSFRASSRKSGPDMDRRRSVGPPSGTASSASIHIPQSALSSQPTMPYPNTPPPRSNQMTMEDIFKRPTYTPPSNNNNTLSNGGSLLPVLGKLGTGNGNWQANTVTLSPPHPSITVGSTTASPWWMSNKISPSTRSENDYLAELLHLMRRQAGGATGGSIAGSSKLSGPASNNLVDYIEVKNGQGVFEKNFYEIQRLLGKGICWQEWIEEYFILIYAFPYTERAKNSEDRSHLNSPLNDNATDRKKKIEKESNDSSNAAAAAAAAAAYSTADYDSYNNNSAAAAASSAMGNILGRGSHDVGLMRKPLRLILADLNKRIELLKTNQAEWEAFQLKIGMRESVQDIGEEEKGIVCIYHANFSPF